MRSDRKHKVMAVMLRHSKHSGQWPLRSPFECLRVTTALYVILFCLFFSVNLLAQSNDQKGDTTEVRLLNADIDKNAIYIIDGQLSKNKMNDIRLNDIIKMDIVKKAKGSVPTLNPGNKDLVTIVTKAFAIKEYQKKFCFFSEKYSIYLKQHQNHDDSCTYVLKGGIVYKNISERIRELYDVPIKEIKGVNITENPWYNGGESKKYVVLITTKQQHWKTFYK